ncbi:MAG: epoxyqueuosine reductase [Leptospiraceae bacterium]|nr:MAG: epoxyqueuosine reductase [Leptospiraceae bacterium]GIX43535.1 MAG: epoxyqueuosine reductase [Leptospiraceae bacterium]
MQNNKFDEQILLKVKDFAKNLGFDLFGITLPQLKKEDYEYLKEFINKKKYANMHWFENYKEIRLHPSKILENCKSVIILGYFYKDQQYEDIIKKSKIKISRYAIGKDYHKILKKKLKKIEEYLKQICKNIQTRITVDSAPVPEKLLAKNAGIGWQGKNTNIIHPEFGSYFFISCIFTDYEIPSNWKQENITDHCKGCMLCIKHCPTGALEPYRLNVEKCISYWTIESKMPVPEEIIRISKGWVFGCDICQEVCPYNRRKIALYKQTNEPDFYLRLEIKKILNQLPEEKDWDNLKNSPLKRVSYYIFKENYKNTLNCEYSHV